MYFSTENLARKSGISPAAVRFHLNAAGHKPCVTIHRFPRHHVSHQWDESAAAFLREKLRSLNFTQPNPLRWIPFSTARARLGVSRSALYRLISSGRVRSRRALVKTPTGCRWFSFLHSEDIETLSSQKNNQTMSHSILSALRRAWLILLSEEERHDCRCLAAYLADQQFITLMSAEGSILQLPLNAPETATDATLSAPDAETWANLSNALSQALETQRQHPGSVLSIAADSADIWEHETKALIAHFPLPSPC